MATKEVAAGGVVLAGGGAGGGYVAYRYLGGSSEDEEKRSESEESGASSTTIKQQLTTSAGSAETGKPLDTENNVDKWKKYHYRYFLEVKNDDEKIEALGGESIRDDKYEDKSSSLKEECKKLLDKPYKKDTDTEYKQAKKWCTTYKTVKETLGEKKDKALKGDGDSGWSTQYATAESDANLKKVLDGLKKEFTSGTDDDKKKKTLHKWCTMSLDASDSYQFKDKVSTVCVFES